jgi:hypothetical protein
VINQRAWISVPLLLGLILPATATRAADEFPYELHEGRELLTITTGVLLGTAALAARAGQDPLQPQDLERLDADGINALDRAATRRWSPRASTVSDLLE